MVFNFLNFKTSSSSEGKTFPFLGSDSAEVRKRFILENDWSGNPQLFPLRVILNFKALH
jgi:hypothetical protein